MVEVSISRRGQFQGTEADVIKGFVVDAKGFVCVLNELMDGQGGVVGLHNCVGHFWGGDNTEGGHNTIWVLLTDLGDEEGSHSGSSATSEGVGELESL